MTRDSRSKPDRAETVEQGSVHESGGAVGNRTNARATPPPIDDDKLVERLGERLRKLAYESNDLGAIDILNEAEDAISSLKEENEALRSAIYYCSGSCGALLRIKGTGER